MSDEFCCEKFELLFLYDKADYISLDSQFWAIVWDKELDATTGIASGFVAEIKFCPFCGQVLQAPSCSVIPLQA